MVKHSQTIRRQITDELFECVWPFCETGAKRVKTLTHYKTDLKCVVICCYLTGFYMIGTVAFNEFS